MKNIQKLKEPVTQIIKNVCKANFSIKTNIQDKIDIGSKKEEQLQIYKPMCQSFSHIGKFKNTALTNFSKYDYSKEVNKVKTYERPTNDFIFKKLFDEKNKVLLIDFINSVLPDRKVKDVEHLLTNMLPEIRIQKQSTVDVLCTDEDGSKYIIEMQAAKEKGFEKRAVYYASKTYAGQMDKGDKYADLKDVIFIAITNFVMFQDKEDFASIHEIRDIKTQEHDLKAFSFAFMELPKFNKEQEGLKGIDKWCDFFKNASSRKHVKTNDPIMQQAYDVLDKSNWTKQELLDYEAHEKMALDNQAREDQIRDEGKAEGIQIGEVKLKEGKEKIVKASLKKGLDVKTISEITGLAKEEIEKIKKEM